MCVRRPGKIRASEAELAASASDPNKAAAIPAVTWDNPVSFVPEGQPLTLTRLIRAAGLRWPVEEGFRLGKDCFGLDQAQVRLYTAIARHTVLVMTTLAICAITAALLTAPMPRRRPPSGRASRPRPPPE